MNATGTDSPLHPVDAALDALAAEGMFKRGPSNPDRLAVLEADLHAAKQLPSPAPLTGRPVSTRDRILNTLATQPWNLTHPRALNAVAWLAGVPADRLTSLNDLSAGEVTVIHDRLTTHPDPAALKAQWEAARASEGWPVDGAEWLL